MAFFFLGMQDGAALTFMGIHIGVKGPYEDIREKFKVKFLSILNYILYSSHKNRINRDVLSNCKGAAMTFS